MKPEERAVIEVEETEVVELKTEADEEIALISVPAEDKVAELEELSDESDDEVIAGVEAGDLGDATGESMEEELKEFAVSDDAQEAA